MFSLKSALVASALLLASSHIASAAETYQIHEDHTWLTFSVSHAGWANAHGVFRKVAGDIVFDKQDVSKSSVSVVIDAASMDTNSEQRDRDMSGADFLNTAEFPQITFKSTRIEQTGERTAVVYGDMTMIGVTKEIALDVTWNAEFPLPWDSSTVKTGFTATGQLNGADFGMNKLVEFGLGPVINVVIDAEALKK